MFEFNKTNESLFFKVIGWLFNYNEKENKNNVIHSAWAANWINHKENDFNNKAIGV